MRCWQDDKLPGQRVFVPAMVMYVVYLTWLVHVAMQRLHVHLACSQGWHTGL